MKEMLYKIIEEAPSTESTDPENLQRLFTQFDEHFLQYCEKELAKINVFYSGLLSATHDQRFIIPSAKIP